MRTGQHLDKYRFLSVLSTTIGPHSRIEVAFCLGGGACDSTVGALIGCQWPVLSRLPV